MKLDPYKTKVLLITHYGFATRTNVGPGALAILDYLKPKVNQVTLIEHPFPHAPDQHSYLSVYKNGQKILEQKVPVFNNPEYLGYLYHMILTCYFILKTKTIYDFSIGFGNFSFLPTFPFRFFGIIDKLIYYTFDYTPFRFKNILLNKTYFLLDKLAYTYSDTNWLLTKYNNINRIKNGFDVKKLKNPEIVPICYDNSKIKVQNKIKMNQIIFSGQLIEANGPQLCIEAMPYLLKKNPKIKLIIAGGGSDSQKLKDLSKNLGLDRSVVFKGFIPDFYDLTKILSESSIGLAPYLPDPKSHNRYADPSKVKLYYSCTLPTIVTSFNPISEEIKKHQAGEVINYNPTELANTVLKMLRSNSTYNKYKKGINTLRNKYDLNSIMKKAITNL